MENYLAAVAVAIEPLAKLPITERIEVLNHIKEMLHAISPFADEPVDCVIWVKADRVLANDYNPNVVAPPEYRLLELSIGADHFTQPIVTSPTEDNFETVDGFHRGLVGKQSEPIRTRIHGYLPITRINQDRDGRTDRIASTIRHNRARGRHGIEAMSGIVVELSRRNWNDAKIAQELGMEADEVLRLKQISGLAEMFANREFSQAWEIDEAALCKI